MLSFVAFFGGSRGLKHRFATIRRMRLISATTRVDHAQPIRGKSAYREKGVDNPAERSPDTRKASTLAALTEEEVTYCRDAGCEDYWSPRSTHDAKDDQEVPVRGADSQQEVGRHDEDWACENKPVRPLGVEDRPDLDAAEEGEEGVDAEDPADYAFGLIAQLVGG
jgi:hypothetical protein